MMNTPTWLCSTSVRYLFSECASACCIWWRLSMSSAEPVNDTGRPASSRSTRTLALTHLRAQLADGVVAQQLRHHLVDLEDGAVQAGAEQARRRVLEQLAVAALGLFQRPLPRALVGDVAHGSGGGDVALVVDRVGANLG